MTAHDIAALTAAGYASGLNVLDAALNSATQDECHLWLLASRSHMVWDASCGITLERR